MAIITAQEEDGGADDNHNDTEGGLKCRYISDMWTQNFI